MKGKFLVLEGIDGCGKSTQLQHLMNWLPETNLMPPGSKLHLTKEPGGTALGLALRELLLHPSEGISPDSLAELLLYSADRAQHISRVVQPFLDKGDWVISDRFSGSTLAYQGYGRQLDKRMIETLESIATQDMVPDLTIWLRLSVEKSYLRRDSREADRMESEGFQFLERVSYGFSCIASQRNWKIVDADSDCASVSKLIEEQIIRCFE